MKAIILTDNGVKLELHQPRPQITRHDDVIVRVKAAGLCRTDIYVADGLIRVPKPLVLGHEFSGIVESVGTTVTSIAVGDKVAVMPFVSCGTCPQCREGRSDLCQKVEALGIVRDGGFAEFVCVPASVAHKIPPAMPFMVGAYAEPVAASLAVLKAGITPHERGLIYGENRISLLTHLILKANNFDCVEILSDLSKTDVAARESSYDYIIETAATADSFTAMIEMVRPGGKIVLKTRKHEPVPINIQKAVLKEITFQSVNYGNFDEGIELMASGKLDLSPLCGKTYALEQYQDFFKDGRSGEAKKLFLIMD